MGGSTDTQFGPGHPCSDPEVAAKNGRKGGLVSKPSRYGVTITNEIREYLDELVEAGGPNTPTGRVRVRLIVETLFQIATDPDHPKVMEAIRVLLDRLDGPIGEDTGHSITITGPTMMEIGDYVQARRAGLVEASDVIDVEAKEKA